MKNRKETDYDTCFTYYLNEQKYEIAKEGVEDLNNTIPITLVILNKKIKQITIIDQVNQIEKTYISTIEGDEKINDITEFTVKIKYKIRDSISSEDNINILSYLKVDNQNKKEILRLIKEIRKEDDMLVLLNRDINKPVLYRDFPLIGSNEFHMPFYIGGNNFNPLEERNGIVLNGIKENNEESKENLDILEEAYNSMIEFIKCILKKYKFLKNKYLLASSKMPKPITYFDDFTKNWFYEKQKYFREKISDLPLIKYDINHKLKDLLLPVFNENYNENFYNIVNNININKKILPEKDEYKNWFNIIVGENNEIKNIELKDNKFIRSWGTTKNESNGVEEINYVYDEINLIKDIENCKNINTLIDKIKQDKDKDENKDKVKSKVINYLNEFILFLKNNCKYEIILNKYSIIPNRNGDFKKLEEVYTDHENRIPKEIMKIYDSISKKKINDELVDIEIKYEYLGDLLKKKNFDWISGYLNEFISEKENVEITKRLVAYPLLSIESDDKKVIEAYKFLSSLHNLNKIKLSIKMKIPTYLWETALNFWFNEFPKEIEKFANIDVLKANLINNNTKDEDVLNWLNQYLDFLESNSPNKDFKNLNIFPNQNGKFCVLKTLHYDSGFPEQFKNMLKKYCNIDKKEILLHKRIETYKSYQKMSESDVTIELDSEFNNFKEKKKKLENMMKNNKENNKEIINKLDEINRKLKDMAFEILCLYPNNKSKDIIKKKYIEKIISPPRTEEQLSQNPLDYLGFAEIIYNKKDKFHIEFIDTETLNYLIYINYIMEILCDEIEKAENFDNIKSKFYGINTRDDLIYFLTKIISFIWDNQNTDYPIKNCIDYKTSEKAVFLNMDDKLVSIRKIKLRKNFDECKNEELLLDICTNKHLDILLDIHLDEPININKIRNYLMNTKLNQNLLNYHIESIHLKEICGKIDNAIKEIDEKSNYDEHFNNLIDKINKLEFEEEKKEYLPYYSKNKSRILIGFIEEKDREELFSIINKKNIKEYLGALKDYKDKKEKENPESNNNDNRNVDTNEGNESESSYNNNISPQDSNILAPYITKGSESQQIELLEYFKDPDKLKQFCDCIKQNEDPQDLLNKLNNNSNNNGDNEININLKHNYLFTFIKRDQQNNENIISRSNIETQESMQLLPYKNITFIRKREFEIRESFDPVTNERRFNININ